MARCIYQIHLSHEANHLKSSYRRIIMNQLGTLEPKNRIIIQITICKLILIISKVKINIKHQISSTQRYVITCYYRKDMPLPAIKVKKASQWQNSSISDYLQSTISVEVHTNICLLPEKTRTHRNSTCCMQFIRKPK